MATSEQFGDDSTASSARRLYDQVKRQLTQRYDNPESNEFVSDEVWAPEKDFCMALENGERAHACIWTRLDNQLGDDLEKIFLMVNSDDGYETSSVSLIYEFPGFDEATVGDDYGLDSL